MTILPFKIPFLCQFYVVRSSVRCVFVLFNHHQQMGKLGLSGVAIPAWRPSFSNRYFGIHVLLRRSDIFGDLNGETFQLFKSNPFVNNFSFLLLLLETQLCLHLLDPNQNVLMGALGIILSTWANEKQKNDSNCK